MTSQTQEWCDTLRDVEAEDERRQHARDVLAARVGVLALWLVLAALAVLAFATGCATRPVADEPLSAELAALADTITQAVERVHDDATHALLLQALERARRIEDRARRSEELQRLFALASDAMDSPRARGAP